MYSVVSMYSKNLSSAVVKPFAILAASAFLLSPAFAQSVVNPAVMPATPAATVPDRTASPGDPAQDLNRVVWHSVSQPAVPAANFDEAIDRTINNERLLIAKLKTKKPVIETYVQEVKPDSDLGFVPKTDFYFLGKLDMTTGIVDDSFLRSRGSIKSIPHVFTALFTTEYYSRGFADEMFPDDTNFDRAHYDFTFVRLEFLGAVRCIVVDVKPKRDAGKRRFEGRVWIDDRDYNVIRFNGTYVPSPAHEFSHFDSWRVNEAGMWLPAYIYAQDESSRFGPLHFPPMRAQTRLWDYETNKDRAQQAFTNLTVDIPQGVKDESQVGDQNYSPVQAERLWQTEAEDNVIDRLQQAGLAAPSGEVEQVLDQVLNNIEVTNNINLPFPVHVRIQLTTPLESVAVGHSILLSRGLVDVLPDEACLAAVIAHELAHIMLGHSINTKYAFADRLMFDDPATLKKISVARTQTEEAAADEKAIQLLKNSPYASQLQHVGLFLRMLSARSDEVPHLIKPLMGNKMADTHQDLRLSGLAQLGPKLEIRDLNQIAALPLGSRIKMDPWSDQLRLLKTQNVALISPKEKMPFEVTPFMIFETYESDRRQPGANTVASTAPQPATDSTPINNPPPAPKP
jgi:hypothetical protein